MVHDESWPLYAFRLFSNADALSNGSRICGSVAPRITGFENDGFSERNSSSDRFASFAATATSMSRDVVTVTKYGWFGMSGSARPYCCGFAMMFFTACSFGT